MEKMNYEKAVSRLEEMMKLYEEGTALAGKCAKALDKAQLKISELSSGKVKEND